MAASPQKPDEQATYYQQVGAERSRAKLISAGSWALIVVMLLTVFYFQGRLNHERAKRSLTYMEPLENAPPMLAFTSVALGGFRGMISTALWFRLNEMQLEDKFFEMMQLAEWITQLQPHIPGVWTFQAWNLGYNISVKYEDNRDRWQWVYRGICLLRDEGLKYNPNEPTIYHELAWHFEHKMGAQLDNAHRLYKREWYLMWDKLLTMEKDDQGVIRTDFDRLTNPANADDTRRAQEVKLVYKMDPGKMAEVDARYGPLDWRMPETHSLYWAYLGIQLCENNPTRAHLVRKLRRRVYNSMAYAVRRGRPVYKIIVAENEDGKEIEQELFDFGPNLDLFIAANQTYLEQIGRKQEMYEAAKTIAEKAKAANQDQNALEAERDMEHAKSDYASFQHAHRNWLREVFTHLFVNNRENEARAILKGIIKYYPEYAGAYMATEDGKVNMDKLALERVAEYSTKGGRDKVLIMIKGLMNKYYYHLAIGEEDDAIKYRSSAIKVYNLYRKRTENAEGDRVKIPTYRDITAVVRVEMLQEWKTKHEAIYLRLLSVLGEDAPPETDGTN